jgi:hypothetical protein
MFDGIESTRRLSAPWHFGYLRNYEKIGTVTAWPCDVGVGRSPRDYLGAVDQDSYLRAIQVAFVVSHSSYA